MGSLSFNEYADSPTIFAPPQEHSFCPSSYTHFIQHHQPLKPLMEPEPSAPATDIPVGLANPATPRHSRKRSLDESSGEDAAWFDSRVQRLGSSNSSNGEVTGFASSSDEKTGSSQTEIPNCLEGMIDKEACYYMDTSSDTDISGSAESSEGVEDRRKFSRQGPVQDADATSINDPMTLALGLGWRSIGNEPERQAAARGWAKFIERRYTIDSVKVLARRTDDYLLVVASDGIYIFTDVISHGALVARSWSECVAEFRVNPRLEFGDRRMIFPVDRPTLSEPHRLKNAEGQTVDSTSSGSPSDEARTPPPPPFSDPMPPVGERSGA
ncbi:MAG: hypothetical protein Q9225_005599 [Loekoesia sp. 1 TL-2023]